MIFQQLFLASDHAGVALKHHLIQACQKLSFSYKDLGPFSSDISVDYPDYAKEVVLRVLNNPASGGVLICGSGQGMAIAANRYPGIRAAVCLDAGATAILARQHNNANILCLGARLMNAENAITSLQAFLNTDFDGGRHQKRLDKIVSAKQPLDDKD